MRNLLTAGERPSPALRPFFPTLGAPATGRTEDGDSRELCDVLGPRGPQMSHTSPAMTVSCGGPGHHEAQKLVRGWWLEPQERPMLLWGGASSHQERPMLFRGWWLEPGPGHQPAEPLVILGVSLPASTRQRQDNFLATRICPVRTARCQEFRHRKAAAPGKFLGDKNFSCQNRPGRGTSIHPGVTKSSGSPERQDFFRPAGKILPFILAPEPIARFIHR